MTDSYDGERAMVGETLASPDVLAQYLEPDVLQMGFLLLEATVFWNAGSSGNAAGLGRAIDGIVSALPPTTNGTFATIIGNHDFARATAAVEDDPGALRVMGASSSSWPRRRRWTSAGLPTG